MEGLQEEGLQGSDGLTLRLFYGMPRCEVRFPRCNRIAASASVSLPLSGNRASLREGQASVVQPTRYTFAGCALLVEKPDHRPSPLALEQVLDYRGARTVCTDAKEQAVAIAEQVVATRGIGSGFEALAC